MRDRHRHARSINRSSVSRMRQCEVVAHSKWYGSTVLILIYTTDHSLRAGVRIINMQMLNAITSCSRRIACVIILSLKHIIMNDYDYELYINEQLNFPEPIAPSRACNRSKCLTNVSKMKLFQIIARAILKSVLYNTDCIIIFICEGATSE